MSKAVEGGRMLKRIQIWLAWSVLSSAVAGASPLFPETIEQQHAKRTLAQLSAQGLLKTDTFKGDRASSRWEAAEQIQKAIERLEASPETLEKRSVLATLHELLQLLGDDFRDLDLKLNHLLSHHQQLDQRVSELERITFYGSLNLRSSATRFHHSDSFNPMLVANSKPNSPPSFINYDQAVGSNLGAGGLFSAPSLIPSFNPFTLGVLSNTNWGNGRPLVSGVGFTAKGVLGLKVNLNPEVQAGLEIAAYTAEGNSVIDGYYGVPAPYLSNNFTGTSTVDGTLASTQPLNHLPFTRTTLDHFWLLHKPSQTRVRLGAFKDTQFSSGIYAGMVNPNIAGGFLDNFGFQITGKQEFDDCKLFWEVAATRLPDGNSGALRGTPGFGQSYWSHAEGFNLRANLDEGRANLKFSLLRAANEASGGSPTSVGLLQVPNLTLNWVNPNGYFVNQQILQSNSSAVAGISSTSDRRPIAMTVFPASLSPASLPSGFHPDGEVRSLLPASSSGPNFGGFGPQDQTSLALEGDYRFRGNFDPRISFQFAHSVYSPQKGSGYSVAGNALKVGGGASFFDKTLNLELSFIQVDPRFDPFVIPIPTLGGIQQPLWRAPDNDYYSTLSALHNTRDLPHNRTGLRLKSEWKFNPNGSVTADYAHYRQTQSSLQDVRFSGGSVGANTPNTDVLGYSPGFMDPIFFGLSRYTFASDGTNTLATPLENPKGHGTLTSLNLRHKWLLEDKEPNPRGVNLWGAVRYSGFQRDSQLSKIRTETLGPIRPGLRGENVNYVNLNNFGWRLGLDYDLTRDFKIRGSYGAVKIYGHYDPLGLYSAYADSVGSARFQNLNIEQTWPEIGFTWNLSDSVSWGLDGRYYNNRDLISSEVFAAPSSPALNLNSDPIQAARYSVHPYNWQGLELSANLSVKF